MIALTALESSNQLPALLRALEPLSVPLVVGLMVMGVWIEMRRDAEQAQRYDAIISAHAYQLRRQLRSWLPWPEEPRGRLRKIQDRAVEKHFGPAEDRAVKIVRAGASASDDYAESAREVYVLFYRATRLMNEVRAAEIDWVDAPDGKGKVPVITQEVVDKMDRAERLIRACIVSLDDAVSPELDQTVEALEMQEAQPQA